MRSAVVENCLSGQPLKANLKGLEPSPSLQGCLNRALDHRLIQGTSTDHRFDSIDSAPNLQSVGRDVKCLLVQVSRFAAQLFGWDATSTPSWRVLSVTRLNESERTIRPNYNLPARSEHFNGRLCRQMYDDLHLAGTAQRVLPQQMQDAIAEDYDLDTLTQTQLTAALYKYYVVNNVLLRIEKESGLGTRIGNQLRHAPFRGVRRNSGNLLTTTVSNSCTTSSMSLTGALFRLSHPRMNGE